MPNWHSFEGTVLALVFSSGSTHYVLGSAIMVAPCVALGASHSVRDLVLQLRSGHLSLIAVGVSTHGAQIWQVKYGACIERTDLCILTLELLSEPPITRKLHQAVITTRLPAIGEKVVVAGFRASRDEFEQGSPNTTLELEAGVRITSGAVRQSFPKGRDSRLVPWPALEVDAPLFGGMSGGPVFDMRGGVIGLGSRSMELGVGEEPSPMVVALLWPVLGQRFPLAGESAGTTLLELHEAGLMLIERPSAVSIAAEGQGILTTYTPWN
jgi:hypothetical protein